MARAPESRDGLHIQRQEQVKGVSEQEKRGQKERGKAGKTGRNRKWRKRKKHFIREEEGRMGQKEAGWGEMFYFREGTWGWFCVACGKQMLSHVCQSDLHNP